MKKVAFFSKEFYKSIFQCDLSSPEWCDIVFERRNKEYGAYKMRQSSSKRLVTSSMLTFIIFGISILIIEKTMQVSVPQIAVNAPKATYVVDFKDLKNIPVIQQEKTPLSPLKSTTKFTSPEVVSSAEIGENDGCKSQDELMKTKLQISILDIAGIEEGVDIDDFKDYLDEHPQFPGGEKELRYFISKHLKYSETAAMHGIQGNLSVKILINGDGRATFDQIIGDANIYLVDEVIRCIKKMPKWNPGKRNGKNVPAYIILPIDFIYLSS